MNTAPERLQLRPRAGVVVLDPDTRRPLPLEGADVPSSTYWLRRLADGDVETMQGAPAVQHVPEE